MSKCRFWFVFVLVFLGLSAPALAQDPDDITRENVELAPFAGYRTGGGLTGGLDDALSDLAIQNGASYGVTVDFNLHKANFKFELRYSHHGTQLDTAGFLPASSAPLDVDYLHAGFLQETGSPKSRFFVSVLTGVTRFAPRGFDPVRKFSISLGGGAKIFLSRNIGIRLEGRAYLTFVETDAGAFCANGTCLFAFGGSNMWQGEFTGGLILAF
jgi:hypothetical protein